MRCNRTTSYYYTESNLRACGQVQLPSNARRVWMGRPTPSAPGPIISPKLIQSKGSIIGHPTVPFTLV